MKGFSGLSGFKYRLIPFVTAALNANNGNREASGTPLFQKPRLPVNTTNGMAPSCRPPFFTQ
tara:strand:+ start:163 stop:348 length:186 start_codon:yes stop_codon:yes gene_type:complete